MICLFSTSFSHGSNLSNLVRILFQLRDKLSQTAFLQTWLGRYIPRRRISFRTAGSCLSRVHRTAVYRRIALDWRPRLCYFQRRGGGYISSRAAPFPMTGKGRGDWVEHERRFTYELYQQSLWAHDERDPPSRSTRPAEGTGRNALCGVSLLERDRLPVLLSGAPQKAGPMCGHLARKNALFARFSSLGFWGGNMIICPVRILLNTFHIFRSAGEQFLLFPGISTLGHFVPKLRNGASAPGRRQPGLGRLPNKHFGKYFSAARRKNLECVHTRIACQKRKCGYTCPACR